MNITVMMKSYLPKMILSSGLLVLSGCSSVMTHTGGQDGYYPGTRASYDMLTDDETSWGYKPFVALDMPFTAVMDTVLLPWDMFRTDKSVKSRVEASESKNLATNSVIPPAQ
jgi:uncharacterized protein YceK